MDLAVEDMAAEDILTGTMTITAATQVDIQDLETILQPTPRGMTILGLELKSKFAWCLVLKGNLTCCFEHFFSLPPYLCLSTPLILMLTLDTTAAVTGSPEAATVIQTEMAVIVAPLMATEADHMEEALAEALAATRCLT